MSKVHDTATALLPFLQATLDENWDEAKSRQKEVVNLEREADKLKTAVRIHLPKSLFMPVPRSDLLELVTMQDQIANCAKDIAGLMLGRKMTIPEPLRESMIAYAEACIETSAQAQKAIQELDELVETGFGGREVKVVELMIKELDKQEALTDKLQVKLRAKLFKLEKDMPPVDVMFLYRIIDWIGDLADYAERVGSRLQILMAR